MVLGDVVRTVRYEHLALYTGNEDPAYINEEEEDMDIDEDTEPETRDEQVNEVDENVKHYTNQYYALVICKTHLLTPGNGASWLRHVPQNRDAQYRHGRKMSVTILTLMCVIVSHFTTLRHLVCQWDRLFLQAEVFLKCASLASHFHEMVCHMFDSNVRRWNVMVCHFLWRKVRHGIKMYDSHRYNDAPFPGVKRCVLQMTSALLLLLLLIIPPLTLEVMGLGDLVWPDQCAMSTWPRIQPQEKHLLIKMEKKREKIWHCRSWKPVILYDHTSVIWALGNVYYHMGCSY